MLARQSLRIPRIRSSDARLHSWSIRTTNPKALPGNSSSQAWPSDSDFGFRGFKSRRAVARRALAARARLAAQRTRRLSSALCASPSRNSWMRRACITRSPWRRCAGPQQTKLDNTRGPTTIGDDSTWVGKAGDVRGKGGFAEVVRVLHRNDERTTPRRSEFDGRSPRPLPPLGRRSLPGQTGAPRIRGRGRKRSAPPAGRPRRIVLGSRSAPSPEARHGRPDPSCPPPDAHLREGV